MDGHALLLEFSNKDRGFALGVEVGRVWAILNATDDAFDCEMHIENAEMVLRLAEATGRSVSAEIHDDVWLTAFFSEVA